MAVDPLPRQKVRSSRWGDLDMPEVIDLDKPTVRELAILQLVDVQIASLSVPGASIGRYVLADLATMGDQFVRGDRTS